MRKSIKKRILPLCLLLLLTAFALLLALYKGEGERAAYLKRALYPLFRGPVTFLKSERVQGFKQQVLFALRGGKPEIASTQQVGLPDEKRAQLYCNGQPTDEQKMQPSQDYKMVYRTADCTRLVNYPDGYLLDLPPEIDFDFSRSAAMVQARAKDGSLVCTISNEYCPYAEVEQQMAEGLAQYAPDFAWQDAADQYIGFYQCRFLMNAEWQKNNQVTVSPMQHIEVAGYPALLLDAKIENVPEDKFDAYRYLFLKLKNQRFIRIMLKYRSENSQVAEQALSLLCSFRSFEAFGTAQNATDYAPVLPENWSAQTKAVYQSILDTEQVRWGIYARDIYNEGINATIPALEDKLSFNFRTVLAYTEYNMEFPTAFMEKNAEAGRMVELTYHLTENSNMNMLAKTPMLEIYRGQGEGYLRAFAKKAKQFGKPFLFRVCNEMNSDWTSYSGVVNMADPDLFIEVYQEIAEVFRQEGVDNCIWIFNPNDRNAPPSRWNDSICYYPGDDYVQIIGVTGYNNGTYYTKWMEQWREFAEIYDAIEHEYQPTFGAFPWMITEFSSSGIGGDKPRWIDRMFAKINDYKNIKLAVWYSANDMDENGNIARSYVLDETPETTEAFRRGLSMVENPPWPE